MRRTSVVSSRRLDTTTLSWFRLQNLHCHDCIKQQSPDIAQGVHEARDELDVGAGDQGIMFGYATVETPEYMPLTASYLTNSMTSLLSFVAPRKSVGMLSDVSYLEERCFTVLFLYMNFHGGGAFSGKDLTKIDLSAAYGAPGLAKAIVAVGFANPCLVQLSYPIPLV